MRDIDDSDTLELKYSNFVGYARVSTPEQDISMQVEALKQAGCQKIFTDIASGAKATREGLSDALNYLREEDTLVVWSIDRLGRSLSHLVSTVEELRENGVAFKSLTNGSIDTTTNNGKLLFNFFAILADFERELIRERTISGLHNAKVRGRKGGRKPVITEEKLMKAKSLMDKGLTVRETAAAIKVGKSSLYKALSLTEQTNY